jgi:uncharacterized membrane protein
VMVVVALQAVVVDVHDDDDDDKLIDYEQLDELSYFVACDEIVVVAAVAAVVVAHDKVVEVFDVDYLDFPKFHNQ